MSGSGEKKNNFWMTLSLLVGIDWKKNVIDDVQEWLDNVDARRVAWTPEVSSDRPKQKANCRSSASASASASASTESNEEKEFVLQLPEVDCSFRHPKLRSRLERLMGSNLVHLTDRQYMLQLHHRILEDYIETMEKRIADREARERNREKELVLTGKIPLDEAPDGMKHHPILLINNYCQKLIKERRAKIKVPKVHIHNHMYLDDTPDPPPGLTISEGHVFRKPEDELCVPPSTHLAYSAADDVERGYMFPEEDFERKRKYESPEVRDLENAETVEEMYQLADEIIGPLKTIKSVPEEEEEPAAAT